MESLPYITVYEAVRLIVAMLPGGEPFPPTLTDEWIRGGYAMEEPEGSKLVAIYREAVDLLKRAVRSPDVRITGVSASRRADGRREIRDEERGLRLEMRWGLFRGDATIAPAFLDPLICADALKREITDLLDPPRFGSNAYKQRAVDQQLTRYAAALDDMGPEEAVRVITKRVAREHKGLSVGRSMIIERLADLKKRSAD